MGAKKVLKKLAFPDGTGNELRTVSDGKAMKVKLKLRSESRVRNIGTIYLETRVFVVHREIAKHLHRKSNSYGFNEKLIKETKKFDQVRLIDENGEYQFPRELILTEGEYLFFKQQGFELQKFLSYDRIRQFKVKSAHF